MHIPVIGFMLFHHLTAAQRYVCALWRSAREDWKLDYISKFLDVKYFKETMSSQHCLWLCEAAQR